MNARPAPKVVLLCGASGFIGSHLAQAIEAAGHTLLCAVRDPAVYRRRHPRRRVLALDFEAAPPGDALREALKEVDAVVNAVGIARERRPGDFERLHTTGPVALFEAAAAAGVRTVVQLSALGADAAAETDFHRSKRAADEALLALPLHGVVVQPSLVFGLEGDSTRQLLQLALAPVLPAPRGAGRVQPVRLGDLVALVLRLLDGAPLSARRIAAVGPQPLAFADYLAALRAALGEPPARRLPLPKAWMDAAAAVAGRRPGSVFTRDTWRMLQRGNEADPAPMAALLGRPPGDAAALLRQLGDGAREAIVLQARWPLAQALLRAALALVWLVTAAVSFGLYPVADSLALLERSGVPAPFAPALLFGAAALDLLLGIATLLRPGRRLWWTQLALMGFYTAVISLKLPEFWLHPYGPVLKNLPIAAVLLLLLWLEPGNGRCRSGEDPFLQEPR